MPLRAVQSTPLAGDALSPNERSVSRHGAAHNTMSAAAAPHLESRDAGRDEANLERPLRGPPRTKAKPFRVGKGAEGLTRLGELGVAQRARPGGWGQVWWPTSRSRRTRR
jgi:hypothetical protein